MTIAATSNRHVPSARGTRTAPAAPRDPARALQIGTRIEHFTSVLATLLDAFRIANPALHG